MSRCNNGILMTVRNLITFVPVQRHAEWMTVRGHPTALASGTDSENRCDNE
jgi:hypothetical protein